MGRSLDDMGETKDLLMLEYLGRKYILVVACGKKSVDCIKGYGGLHLTDRERRRRKMYLESF